MPHHGSASPALVPYLEHYSEHGGPAERVPLLKVPFTLGRSDQVDHIVHSTLVSKQHAAIVMVEDQYAVRDLGSTNGTFVNGERIHEHALGDGDILHLAHTEFCFRLEDSKADPLERRSHEAVARTQAMMSTRPESVIRASRLLEELLTSEAVEVVYQPIVNLRTFEVVGYEALGRGRLPGLTESPEMLLRLADQCGMAVELSELFRRIAVTSSRTLPPGPKLFVNVHGRELEGPGFHQSLEALRPLVPRGRAIVIEIAESSVTDLPAMAGHKVAFNDLGFEFAYDDFGAGQARLLELTDIPPDYLKLDMGLIQGIDEAKSRRDMVRALLQVVGAQGVQIIAEGIEGDSTAATCRDLGCHLGQGYFFGRPA